MHKIAPFIVSFLLIAAIQSCHRRSVPNRSEANTELKGKTAPAAPTVNIEKKNDSLVAAKPVIKKTAPPASAIPKVIAVNDKFANKSVDGRYYYDVEGHRYWRSNKDGKYYLYNKSMQTDEAFKKPQNK